MHQGHPVPVHRSHKLKPVCRGKGRAVVLTCFPPRRFQCHDPVAVGFTAVGDIGTQVVVGGTYQGRNSNNTNF